MEILNSLFAMAAAIITSASRQTPQNDSKAKVDSEYRVVVENRDAESARRLCEFALGKDERCFRAIRIGPTTLVSLSATVDDIDLGHRSYGQGFVSCIYVNGAETHLLSRIRLARGTMSWDRTPIFVVNKFGSDQGIVVVRPPALDHHQFIVIRIGHRFETLAEIVSASGSVDKMFVGNGRLTLSIKDYWKRKLDQATTKTLRFVID